MIFWSHCPLKFLLIPHGPMKQLMTHVNDSRILSLSPSNFSHSFHSYVLSFFSKYWVQGQGKRNLLPPGPQVHTFFSGRILKRRGAPGVYLVNSPTDISWWCWGNIMFLTLGKNNNKTGLSTQKGKFKLDSYPSFTAAVGQERETKEELFFATLHYRHCWSLDRAGKNYYLVTFASFLQAWNL